MASSSEAVAVVASAIADELRGPVAEQDEAITAVLNLQTALCARVDELTLRLQQIPRTSETSPLVATYTQKIMACRARLQAINGRLDVVERRVEQAERRVAAP
jgi:hypothetical protein